MSADLCGACGRAILPADVDEVEAAIRTLRMRAEDGEPRAAKYAAAPDLLAVCVGAERLLAVGNDPDVGARSAFTPLVRQLRAALAKAGA